VHLAAALTLFGVVRRTLAGQRYSEAAARAAPWLALTTAVIWVVHPLQTQSVTYLIQRGESLMGLFYLLTLYCVIRGNSSKQAALWYAGAVGACLLGMGSKAVMLSAPLVVLVYDRVFLSRSFGEMFRRRWALYLGLACTWGALWTTGVARGVLKTGPDVRHATVGFGYQGVTPLEYALTQPGVILHYLRLSVWPDPLCLDYQWPVAETAGAIVPTVIVIVLLLAGTGWALVRRPWLGFVGLWFFVILGPTSSFIPIKDIAFEHRMYLSLAAVVVLGVLVGHKVLARLLAGFPAGSPPRTFVMTAVVAVLVAPLAYATIRRNEAYHSRETMYRDVIRTSPHNTRAINNLAAELRQLGRGDEAMEMIRRALEVDPKFGSALFNMGALLEEQAGGDRRKLAEALEYYRAAVEDDPSAVTRCEAVAKVLDKLGRSDEALRAYRDVLALEQGHFEARLKVASLLMAQGRRAEAIPEYRKAVVADPSSKLARYHLGLALRDQGELAEAVEALEGVVHLDPGNADARCDLGSTLVALGRVEEGIGVYREALRSNPGHAHTHYNLGIALQSQEKYEEAAAEYRETVRLSPDYAPAYSNLGVVLKRLGRPAEAIVAYQQAIEADPTHVISRFNLGVTFYEQRRLGEAAEQFQAILTIDPDYERARQALERVRRIQKQQDQRRRPGGSTTQPAAARWQVGPG
jgi:tetratricopeptide (TPR) repeat protein